ncbi:hypothetical protein QBC34DRAFT_478183 [Podospora aff. communis PSN243]|uniref:Ecp2 effector protein domain-containing protein n=1 Tax=Podospora aff. communis PSN243 TaxID=3040156 RepID=A0AAV9G3Z7_9PEZI|nr:hypothetical protein QBC34DRAFT_478183 [Podospora aff. communis PSN243]
MAFGTQHSQLLRGKAIPLTARISIINSRSPQSETILNHQQIHNPQITSILATMKFTSLAPLLTLLLTFTSFCHSLALTSTTPVLLPTVTPIIKGHSSAPLFFRNEVILLSTRTSILSEISLYSTGLATLFTHPQSWSSPTDSAPQCNPYALYCAIGDHYHNAYTFHSSGTVCARWSPGPDVDVKRQTMESIFISNPGFNKTVVSQAVKKGWGALWGGEIRVWCDARVGTEEGVEGGIDVGDLRKGVLEMVEARNGTWDVIV